MMYKNLLFTSPKGKTILFDDFVEEYDEEFKKDRPYWAEMCPHCHRKYRGILRGRFDGNGSAQATCSVNGCNNEAAYYVDFLATDNLKIVEVEDDERERGER